MDRYGPTSCRRGPIPVAPPRITIEEACQVFLANREATVAYPRLTKIVQDVFGDKPKLTAVQERRASG